MSRGSRANRTSATLTLAGLVLLAGSADPSATAGPTAPTPTRGGIPVSQVRSMESEALRAQPPAVVADRDSAADQLGYARAAAALPVAQPGLKWANVGPLGQDNPADYPAGAIRFARSSGMGSALAVDPRDPSGNTLYSGTIGGLWHTRDGGAHWTALGDKEFARSAVGAIAVDPAHPGDVYVGTGVAYLTLSGDSPGSGVYVSHDGGKTFTRPTANIRGYGVNAITVTTSGVLFGTTNGLYLSTDRGASLRRVPLPTDEAHSAPATGAYANWISAIAVNPLDPQAVTVAVGMPYGKRLGPDGKPLSPGNGLYRSTSGAAGAYAYLASSAGLTHPAASNQPLGRIMLSYVKDPGGDSTVLWAIVQDAGLLNRAQPAQLDLVGTTTGRNLNATNTLFNGLYRSDDDGATWKVKATPQSLAATVNEGLGFYPALGYGVGVQAFYNLWVAADPTNPDMVYFGLEEVFQSLANTGETPGIGEFEVVQRYWDLCGSSTYLENLYPGMSCPEQTPYYGGVSTHPDQHVGVPVVVGDAVRLYTGNDGGFFRQDSHALPDGRRGMDNDSWQEMNTVPTVQPWEVARKPDGEYLSALQDNGTGFFAPGETQTLVTLGDGLHVIATADPDTFYMSAQGAILWVTTDHGKTIRNVQPNLLGPAFGSPIVMDPTDENHLIAAGQDLQETVKGADTQTVLDPVAYTVVTTDWTSSFTFGNSPTVINGKAVPWSAQAIAVRGPAAYAGICGLCRNSLGDPKLIATTIATNVQAGCEAKKAAADCWHVAKGKGLPHVAISAVAIDPVDVRTIYVTLNENSLVGLDQRVVGAQRVMVSRDAGESFTDITGNLPRSNARDIVIRGKALIVATDHGVFTRPISGGAWSRLGTGLPPVRIFDLSLDPAGRHLTISAYGRGVWNLDFSAKAPSTAGPGPKGAPVPPKPRRPAPLPATGGRPALAVLGLVLLAGAWSTRRRPGRLARS